MPTNGAEVRDRRTRRETHDARLDAGKAFSEAGVSAPSRRPRCADEIKVSRTLHSPEWLIPLPFLVPARSERQVAH